MSVLLVSSQLIPVFHLHAQHACRTNHRHPKPVHSLHVSLHQTRLSGHVPFRDMPPTRTLLPPHLRGQKGATGIYTACLKVASIYKKPLWWESELSQLQTSTLFALPTPMTHHMMICFSAPNCVWASLLLCSWESLPGQTTTTFVTPGSWWNAILLSSTMTPSNSSCPVTKPTSFFRGPLSYSAQVVCPATQWPWPCSTHISFPTTTSSPCPPLSGWDLTGSSVTSHIRNSEVLHRKRNIGPPWIFQPIYHCFIFYIISFDLLIYVVVPMWQGQGKVMGIAWC